MSQDLALEKCAAIAHSPAAQHTVAALLLGGICASIGYGAGCLQMITYVHSRSRDGPWFRGLIWFLWLCDTGHMGLVAHCLYHYFVLNYANPCAIMKPIWSLILEQSVTLIVELAARSVFISRVWSLSKRNFWLTGYLCVLSFGAMGLGAYFSYRAFIATNFDQIKHLKWLVISTLATHLLVDLNITLALALLLRRSRTGFDTMDTVLRTLIGFVIQTGLATMLISALTLTSFVVDMDSFIFAGIYFMLCKVFFNALLASLNARDTLLASTVEAGVSMTVLSKRRGEESRKDYDTLYNVHTPASASMPDLASGHQRSISRHSNHPGDPYTPAPRRPRRRPSHASQGSTSKSLRRVSTQNQDGGPHMFQVGSPTRRSGSIMRVRTRDEDLIPELPRFTHRINLSGRDSILISPSPVPEPGFQAAYAASLHVPSSNDLTRGTSANSSQATLSPTTARRDVASSVYSDLPYWHDEVIEPPPGNSHEPVRYPTFLPY